MTGAPDPQRPAGIAIPRLSIDNPFHDPLAEPMPEPSATARLAPVSDDPFRVNTAPAN